MTYPLIPARAAGPLDGTTAQRLLAAFLAGRSPATLRGYEQDLRDFARFAGTDTTDAAAALLLSRGAGGGNETGLLYRAHLQERGLSPSTINRRLAALRSLVKLSRTLGLVVVGPWKCRACAPRRTATRAGRAPRVIASCWPVSTAGLIRGRSGTGPAFGCSTISGCGGSRSVGLDLADFDPVGAAVMVLGKGRLEKVRLTLPPATSAAIAAWVAVRPATDSPALFVRVDRRGGGRLDGSTVYRIVRALGEGGGHPGPAPTG